MFQEFLFSILHIFFICGRAYHPSCLDTTRDGPVRTLWNKCVCGESIDPRTVPDPNLLSARIWRAYEYGSDHASAIVKKAFFFATFGLISHNILAYGHLIDEAIGISEATAVVFLNAAAGVAGVAADANIDEVIITGAALAAGMGTSTFGTGFVAATITTVTVFVCPRAGAFGVPVAVGVMIARVGAIAAGAGVIGSLISFAMVRGASSAGEKIGSLKPVRALCGGGQALKFLGTHLYNRIRNRS